MINLQQILDIVNYFSAKEQEGKTFSSVQFNTMLPKAVNDVFNLFVYKEFDTEQRFTDASLPFKKFMGQDAYTNTETGVFYPAIPPLFIDSNGYAPIPSDYKHYSAIKFKKLHNIGDGTEVKPKDVMVLTDQQFEAWENSVLKKGTHSYPFCNFQNGFIRFAPKDLKQVNFTYLKKPVTPVYGYTTDVVHQIDVYDPTTSVQLEFRDEEIYKLITILLSYVGINLSLQQITEYTNAEIQKGLVV